MRPPDRAAKASWGAEKARAATVAATVNFLAMSAANTSQPLFFSPSPSGDEEVILKPRGRTRELRERVAGVKRADGMGTKAPAGAQASRHNDAVFMFTGLLRSRRWD